MPDSNALRTRRYRLHKAGDHSLCRDCRVGTRRQKSGLGWPEAKVRRGYSPVPRRCSVCDEPMRGLGEWRRTCSPQCAATLERRRKSRRPGRMKPCTDCGKPCAVGKGSRPQPTCRECRRKNPRTNPSPVWVKKWDAHSFASRGCDGCGDDLDVAHRAGGPQVCGDCARARRTQRNRDKSEHRTVLARARRLVHGQTWDGVRDREIFDRDGWRCWICRKVIGKQIRYPHPRSASVDHEVPLSLGGDDTALNKRAAHLACNIARSNRIDQMPLFGYAADAAPRPKRIRQPKPKLVRQPRACKRCSSPLAGKRDWCDPCVAYAAGLRDDGMRWQDISDTLGAYGPGTVYNLVKEYRARAA